MRVIERPIQYGSTILVTKDQQVAHTDFIASYQRQGELVRVLVAEQLKLSPAQAMECLKVTVGQRVQFGQLLAHFRAFAGLFDEKVISFCDGIVEKFSDTDGAIEIRTLPETSNVPSLVNGVVASITERSINIAINGERFQGAVGFGHEISAQLTTVNRGVEAEKNIVVLKDVTEFDTLFSDKHLLEKTAGIIAFQLDTERVKTLTGSSHPLVQSSFNLPYGSIIMDKFGDVPMPGDLYETFFRKSGMMAALFPETQIRAGGKRPYFVIE